MKLVHTMLEDYRGAHLLCPPPFSRVHVEIHPYSMIRIRIVTLGGEDENTCKLRVSKQCTDTCDDVTIEDFEGFPRDDDFPAYEAGTAGHQLTVDDAIELGGTVVRQAKKLRNL